MCRPGFKQAATGPAAKPAISRDERDLLFDRILIRLNGLDAVQLAVGDEDWDTAAALAEEYGALMAVVCADLKWGPQQGMKFQLNSPPDLLARAIRVIEREARADCSIFQDELIAARHRAKTAETLLRVCQRIQRNCARVGQGDDVE
jgi:hypothetical protein